MNDFIIKLGALTNGINSFSFDIKDQFFEAFTLSDVEHADIIATALLDKQKPLTFKTTSERIEASREVKALILGVNEIYKTSKDPQLMDLMKRLTAIKQKIEKRLKGRPLQA